ncbi:MAG: alpha/beta hydrolase, partial [Planctomycetota bacterium]
SFGGSMAFEAARLLTREGIQVEKLILIAPMPLDFHTVGPLRLQLDALRSAPEDLSAGELRSALWRSYGPRKIASRLWRGLGVKNYRRLLRWSGKRGLARGEDLSPRVAHADVRLDRFSLHSRYAPEPISVPTLFFNGDEPETDAAATWKNRFEGPLEIFTTPDPHEGEDAYRLAQEQILRVLDEELS